VAAAAGDRAPGTFFFLFFRITLLMFTVKTSYDGKMRNDGVDGDLNGRGFSLCAAPSLVESGVREFR
jgi:hypothetical protein